MPAAEVGYKGEKIFVPLGQLGVMSDEKQTEQPAASLILANNVICRYDVIERDFGSRKWNLSGLPAGIVEAFDWWPDSITQQMIVVCKNGKIYRYDSGFDAPIEITASAGAPATLNVMNSALIVPGGSESAGRNRKLFIFTGNDPIQVISGNTTVRTNIAIPAADWGVGHYPTGGFIHNQSLFAFGNLNNLHTLYQASSTNHEDFVTIGAAKIYSIFPGKFEKIISGFTYKERLYINKYPRGLYWVDDVNNLVYEISTSFGGRSPKSSIQAIDDMLVGNSSGSITSLKSVFSQGKVEQGDIFRLIKAYRYMQENTRQAYLFDSDALYYEQRKLAMFSYRSSASQVNNRIVCIDFENQTPAVTWNTKDQANCLFLRRDIYNIERPFYGCDDGFIYEMERQDRNLAGSTYTSEFRTPHIDFAWLDIWQKKVGEIEKEFDFLEVIFQPCGNWNINCDYFIDGKFMETISFPMAFAPYLDGNGTNRFQLDHSRLGGLELRTSRMKIAGIGKRISVRLYTNGLNQNFKIAGLSFYFRLGGQNQRS